MSSYSFWKGTIKFKNEKDFNKALEVLGPRLSEDLDLQDEEFKRGLKLKFPDVISNDNGGLNLHLFVRELTRIGFSGVLIGSTTDGELTGFVIVDGVEQEPVDIEEFTKKNFQRSLDEIDQEADQINYEELRYELEELWLEAMDEKYNLA